MMAMAAASIAVGVIASMRSSQYLLPSIAPSSLTTQTKHLQQPSCNNCGSSLSLLNSLMGGLVPARSRFSPAARTLKTHRFHSTYVGIVQKTSRRPTLTIQHHPNHGTIVPPIQTETLYMNLNTIDSWLNDNHIYTYPQR